MSEMLTVAAVARLRGCDHSTAWRLLIELERDYETPLVREKREIRISPDALRDGLARMRGRNEKRLLREVAGLRRRVSDLEDWKKATTQELRTFRRMAHEWFTKAG